MSDRTIIGILALSNLIFALSMLALHIWARRELRKIDRPARHEGEVKP